MTRKKIAVFGSAFNPPHMGHADVVDQALRHFDEVLLVPSFAHAFGKTMAPFPLRLNMVAALVAESNWNAKVTISDIEATIAATKTHGQAIYTFDLLEALEAQAPKCNFTFIVGPDNAATNIWQKFYKAQEIDQRWGRWVAKERKHIRSTAIRNAIINGANIPKEACPAGIVKTYKNHVQQDHNT